MDLISTPCHLHHFQTTTQWFTTKIDQNSTYMVHHISLCCTGLSYFSTNHNCSSPTSVMEPVLLATTRAERGLSSFACRRNRKISMVTFRPKRNINKSYNSIWLYDSIMEKYGKVSNIRMDMFAEPKMPKEIPTAHLRFPWAPQAARVCAPAWRLRWHFWDLMDHAAKAEGLVIATATHRMRGVYHDFCLSPFDKNRPPLTSSTVKCVYEFV